MQGRLSIREDEAPRLIPDVVLPLEHIDIKRLERTAKETAPDLPSPPEVEDINDYIVAAVRENNLTHFTYFLHHYEPRLNKRVYHFLLNESIDRYDPLRFLDYMLSVVLALLECLPNYDPDKGADFLTYAYHFIGNALLDCRRHEERQAPTECYGS